jgi:hypothetical protein
MAASLLPALLTGGLAFLGSVVGYLIFGRYQLRQTKIEQEEANKRERARVLAEHESEALLTLAEEIEIIRYNFTTHMRLASKNNLRFSQYEAYIRGSAEDFHRIYAKASGFTGDLGEAYIFEFHDILLKGESYMEWKAENETEFEYLPGEPREVYEHTYKPEQYDFDWDRFNELSRDLKQAVREDIDERMSAMD